MKRLVPLVLALLLITACGTPTPEPSPTPSATPQNISGVEPEPSITPKIEAVVVAGPEESGYTFRSDELKFSIDIPDEAAPYVVISDGRQSFIPLGEAVTFQLYSYEYERPLGTFGSVMAVRRSDFFDPTTFYNSRYHSPHDVITASDDYIYVFIGSIGGTDFPPEPPEGKDKAAAAVGYNALKANIVVDDPDRVPSLERDSLPDAAKELDAMGEATMTRGEAAKFIFDTLTADNKDKDYPLRFTDVTPGTDEARAIAYLDSYGIFAQYTKDGERIDDGGKFRPDEPITRAEAVQLLQRAQFARKSEYYDYPYWFFLGGSDGAPASDFDETHWAWDVLNRAWYDGWVELEDGKMRPDEPITGAEFAQAFTSLYRELVRYDMELPTVGYADERSFRCGSAESDVRAYMLTESFTDVVHFTCWYSYSENGRLICGKTDESGAVLDEDTLENSGARFSLTFPDGRELYLGWAGNSDDVMIWQSMPYNHESASDYASGAIRGITAGMSADEVMAHFPADKLYSCSTEGLIYGSEDGAYGKIGSDERGVRYIEYSDGESTVRYCLDGADTVSQILCSEA